MLGSSWPNLPRLTHTAKNLSTKLTGATLFVAGVNWVNACSCIYPSFSVEFKVYRREAKKSAFPLATSQRLGPRELGLIQNPKFHPNSCEHPFRADQVVLVRCNATSLHVMTCLSNLDALNLSFGELKTGNMPSENITGQGSAHMRETLQFKVR